MTTGRNQTAGLKRFLVGLAVAFVLSSCSDDGWYSQAREHDKIKQARIDELMKNGKTYSEALYLFSCEETEQKIEDARNAGNIIGGEELQRMLEP